MNNKYIAICTGEPDYHQIYRLRSISHSNVTDDNKSLEYINHTPWKIYKSKEAALREIDEILEQENGKPTPPTHAPAMGQEDL